MCGRSTPTSSDIVGVYAATTLTTTTSGVATDQLAAGASLTITINSDGTTTGRLVAPDAGFDESMAGTWTLSGNTVEFTQSADSFVRNMAFTASRNRLEGQKDFGGTVVRVIMTK